MTVKVSDVMRHVRNHFVRTVITASWQHGNGQLSPAEQLVPGGWIAIAPAEGAPAGVYQLDDKAGIPDLPDMTWTGAVYLLQPPADFLRLCGDIACWAAAHPDPTATGEKLGEYSLSRSPVTWETAFAPALAPYRRMFPEVKV